MRNKIGLTRIELLFATFIVCVVLVGGVKAVLTNVNKSSAPNSTTTIYKRPTTTMVVVKVRYAQNGHVMRQCEFPLRNFTDYSYCYWNGPERTSGSGFDFKKYEDLQKTPIIGANFTFADLTYTMQTTDFSGYPTTEHASITIRPFHNCILANTTFAVDILEMQALNSFGPLDSLDFSGSTIVGTTFEGMGGKYVNLSGAHLANASLLHSDFVDVTGLPASLPVGWIIDTKKDLVRKLN